MKLDFKGTLILAFVIGIAVALFFMPSNNGLQAAPQAQFTTLDNKEISLAELKGKAYLLTFWATDCPGCVEEIPDLVKLDKDFDNQDFEVIAIAMPHDNIPAIRTMSERKGMKYSIAHDADGQLAKQFNIKVTPTNFLVSPEGKIVLKKIGRFDHADVEQRIQAMING